MLVVIGLVVTGRRSSVLDISSNDAYKEVADPYKWSWEEKSITFPDLSKEIDKDMDEKPTPTEHINYESARKVLTRIQDNIKSMDKEPSEEAIKLWNEIWAQFDEMNPKKHTEQ
jgi:hypothetical protein